MMESYVLIEVAADIIEHITQGSDILGPMKEARGRCVITHDGNLPFTEVYEMRSWKGGSKETRK